MNKWIVMCVVALAFVGILAVSATIAVAVFQDSVRSFVTVQTEYVTEQNKIAIQRAAEEARMAAAKAQRDEDYWRGIDGALRATLAGALWLGVVGILVVLGWLSGRALLDVRDRRDLVVIHGIPVGRQLAVDGATLGMAMTATMGHATAQVERARQPVLPDALRTYNHAPRIAEAKPVAAMPMANVSGAPELAEPNVTVPPFYRLLNDGIVSASGNLALGFEPSGKLISAPLDSLFSIAIAGLPGSGKTNTACWIAGQAVLHGARILVADLHAGATGQAGEQSLARSLTPLRTAFMEAAASSADAIAGLARNLRSEVEWRKQGGQGAPILFAADEWSALMRSSAAEELSALMEAIGQEGRKFGIFPLLCGQVWTVDRVGGSALRDVLASSFVHRSKPGQARLLAPGLGNDVFHLPVGHAFLNMTNGDTLRVAVPRVTRADLDRVVDMLPAPVLHRSDSRSWGSSGTFLEPVPAKNSTEHPVQDRASDSSSSVLWPIDPRPLTEVEIAEVRRLRALPTSKTALCELVFGFKNGETWPLINSALGE